MQTASPTTPHQHGTVEAVQNLRRIILAGEHYRRAVAEAIGLGTTESQALSYLAVHGDSGQSDVARCLGLTSSAATALVDRLERQGVAERVRHPRDRRRSIVRLTGRGEAMVSESHRWLRAALERVGSSDLGLVSASLATIAADLSTRASSGQAEGWPDRSRALSG
jgi:DNA-binding MarR family transcriptional regulator